MAVCLVEALPPPVKSRNTHIQYASAPKIHYVRTEHKEQKHHHEDGDHHHEHDKHHRPDHHHDFSRHVEHKEYDEHHDFEHHEFDKHHRGHHGHHDSKFKDHHQTEEPHHEHHYDHHDYHDFEHHHHHEEKPHHEHHHHHHHEEEEVDKIFVENFGKKLVKQKQPDGHFQTHARPIKRDTVFEELIDGEETPSQDQIQDHDHGSPLFYSEEPQFPLFAALRTTRQSGYISQYPVPRAAVKSAGQVPKAKPPPFHPRQLDLPQSELSRITRRSADYNPYPLPPFLVKPSIESAGTAQDQTENPSKESIFGNLGPHHHGPPPFYSEPNLKLPTLKPPVDVNKELHLRPFRRPTRENSHVRRKIYTKPCEDAIPSQHGPIKPIPAPLCSPQKPSEGENQHLLGHDGHGIRKPII